jgi:hypothetical protein
MRMRIYEDINKGESEMEKDYTYNFVTSQPLTQAQIDWLNEQLLENLPTEDEDDLSDIPEWTSEIELQK